ncbi:MAG: chromate transporter [Bradyrhizobiaceae bacterium]|nr:chromate transporter [Bradyrhizobiaceae bacterium]
MPSLVQLGIVLARYANLTFGGGSATSATLHRELVHKRRWLTEDQFALCFALGRVTPGTNLLASCTGFGWVLRRAPGAVTALLVTSIPCAALVATLTALFDQLQAEPLVQAGVHGAVAAAVGVTINTCWTIARPYFKGTGRLRVALIGAAAFILHQWGGLSPIQVLVLAGIVGAFTPSAASWRRIDGSGS